MMRRVVLAVMVIVVLGAGATWWFTRSSQDGTPVEGATQQVQDWSTAEPEVRSAVERAVEAPEEVFATGLDEIVEGSTDEAVPRGTTIDVHDGTWAPDGFGGGTIVATVTYPGEPAVVYLVSVIEEADGWKIMGTTEMAP